MTCGNANTGFGNVNLIDTKPLGEPKTTVSRVSFSQEPQ
jgi:hypothetical protein